MKEFESAIKFNPNNGKSYLFRGVMMQWTKEDYIEAIINYREGAVRNRGTELAGSLKVLGELYCDAGFTNKAANYFQKALELDGDSANYYDY